MGKKTAFITAAIVPFGTLFGLWLLQAKAEAPLLLGVSIGVAVAWISIWMFYKAIADKNKGRTLVALWYGARVALIFGSVVLSLFVPQISSLGVILPQLFPTPIMAIFMAIEK
ncbi:MAG: hypothetical protein PHG02_02060 [Oscillospiraceae bacterium]|nr:hypothetical protein [Oscillospiraceae bacterium]